MSKNVETIEVRSNVNSIYSPADIFVRSLMLFEHGGIQALEPILYACGIFR